MKLKDFTVLENMPNKFYNIPIWFEDEEKHYLHDCFTWKKGGEIYRDYGTPNERIANQYYGSLKKEILNSQEKLIYYLKGCFNSVKEDYTDDTICLYFANGHDIIKRIKYAIENISLKNKNNDFVKKCYLTFPIKSEHHEYSIPICNRLEIYKEFYNFITNFK